MVTIVTGRIDSGKTTELGRLFGTYGGAGYLSVKDMDGAVVAGYDAYELKTGETFRLVDREDRTDPRKPIRDQIGPYCFYEESLHRIETSLLESVEAGDHPLFLDEIGLLELNGKGFAPLLNKLLSTGTDLFLTARNDLVEAIRKTFLIGECRLIHVTKGGKTHV